MTAGSFTDGFSTVALFLVSCRGGVWPDPKGEGEEIELDSILRTNLPFLGTDFMETVPGCIYTQG